MKTLPPIIFAALIVGSLAVHANAFDSGTPENLRRAIQDMMATHGVRYPQGAQFLKRLDQLEARAHADVAQDRWTTDKAFQDLRREALLANPLLDFDRLLVLRRQFPKPEAARTATGAAMGLPQNWLTTAELSKKGRWNDALVEWSHLRGKIKERIVYAADRMETIIDPDLNSAGDRILFAKPGQTESGAFRLWEVGVDGQGLRQISPDDGGDISHVDPCYLPNGDILFCSTAAYQGLPCIFGGGQMASLYRINPQTGIGRQLTFEQDSDWNPCMLPNGRVLYQRWEYTDAAHANSRMLFTMNPDGTDQRVFRGGGSWFPNSFFYARPIPERPAMVIGVAGGHHGVARAGRLLIFDTARGRSNDEGIAQEIPGHDRKVWSLVRDRLVDGVWPQFLMPYPLSANYHLVAMKPKADALWGIYLADVFDNLTLLGEFEGAACLEPIPLRQTAPPPILPERVDVRRADARVHIHDIYAGPGLEGVPRGTVKSLRIIEYYFARRGMGGLYGTLGMDGPWDIKRILGTVPIADDGSFYFTLPANTPVSLQPLDEKGQALQIMRSWFVGMPGEKVSCVGCHEGQEMAPRVVPILRRQPDSIQPWYGPARGFSFEREVQPVLDRHCTGCHNDQSKMDLRGGVMLTNWTTRMPGHWKKGGQFTTAYANLHRFLRRPGIESDRRMLTPMDYHFSQTALGQLLHKGHGGIQLDAEAHARLAAWHDLNAPFYGTWAEVPGIDTNQLHFSTSRALALRRKYVPMGPFPDYDAIPVATPYTPATNTVAAWAPRAPVVNTEPPAHWPFDATTAVRIQQETIPGHKTDKTLVLPLAGAHTRPAAQAVTGRFVRVKAGPARWLSIAETEVYSGGRNVAYGCHAYQSSTAYNGVASLAVDGDRQGTYGAGSITHTGQGPSEWWEVELAGDTVIERIELWNRTDTATERLAGVWVEILDARHKPVWSARSDAHVGRRLVFGVSSQPDNPSLSLVWIPPGAFIMGSDGRQRDEYPPHRVSIDRGFWMGRFEITNEQFRQFNPSHESRDADRHGYQFGITGYDQDQPEQPAVRVSWREAQAFCEWLSSQTGKKVRLPTEAQWEWACRAGTSTPFWFGDHDADWSKKANFGDAMLAYFAGDPYEQNWRAAWFKNPDNPHDNWIPQDARHNDDGFVTEPVGRYAPNPWGLHDAHGNAWEWTRSTYQPYPCQGDDASLETEKQYVARGGSWYDRPSHGTSSYRQPYPAWQKVHNVGFRIIVEE